MERFKLVSPFKPTGDQPQAIEKLVEGIRKGYRYQTLLGATGTGKSLDGAEPVFIARKESDGFRFELVPIGELIEAAIKRASRVEHYGDTVVARPEPGSYWTLSFNARTGEVEPKPIMAFIRHRAPERMFRVTLKCGRSAVITGDHNLWVLRDGQMHLLPTTEIRPGDYIPIPLSIPAPAQDLPDLNLLDYLQDAGLFIQARQQIAEYIAARGGQEFTALLAPHYSCPEATESFQGTWHPEQAHVAGRLERSGLPLELRLTDAFLRLLGCYLAEGTATAKGNHLILANRSPQLRERIAESLTELGLRFTIRPSSDFQISSAPLARLFARLAGRVAREKHLPPFWPQLSNRQLAILLQAYFDGDGTVERDKGCVTVTTASQRLAYELAYALLRFGIWARIQRVRKRATNGNHPGDWYWKVSISGQENLRAFHQHIGFSLAGKAEALEQEIARKANSSVDIIPDVGSSLRDLRLALGVSQKLLAQAAGVSQKLVSAIECQVRNPSRASFQRLLEALSEIAGARHHEDEKWWEDWRKLQSRLKVRWSPVASVEPASASSPYVYDLSVAGNETFLAGAGGLFVHNTFVMAKVIEQVQKPTLVIAHNKTLAAQLYAEFREFFPHNAVEYFVSYYDYYQPEAYLPEYDLYIEKDADINEEIDRLRLAATSALFSRRDVIIVASVSCIYGLGSPEDYGQVVLTLRRGEVRRRNKILRHLVEIQYERNDTVLERGRFRVRGDTVEVQPAYLQTAYRIEFWGDEIERITEFDPLTGEILRELDSVAIYPAKHFITPYEKLQLAIRDIEQELEERLAELRAQGKLLEAQRLEQRTRYDLELLKTTGYCPGIENYSRHLSRRKPGEPPWTLLDYFPDDFLVIIDESHMTIPQLRGMYHGDYTRKKTLVDYGFRLPSALDNRPLKFEEFEQRVRQVIFTSATPGPYELEKSEQVVEQLIRPTGIVDPKVEVRPTKGQIDDLISEIRKRVEKGQRALVTTLTKRMAEDLAEYLAEMGIKVHYLHSEIDTIERVEILRNLRLGVYDVVVGINLLREGLDLPEVSLVAILDADKEGFLRSETALIQTIGRAARHVEGTAIMYADTITESMRRAIEETERRRRIQMEYNLRHGIEPRSIVKEVRDLTDRVRKVAERKAEYIVRGEEIPKDEIRRMIKELENQMHIAAKNLEFEKAAMLRDEIFELRRLLGENVPEIEKVLESKKPKSAEVPAIGKMNR